MSEEERNYQDWLLWSEDDEKIATFIVILPFLCNPVLLFFILIFSAINRVSSKIKLRGRRRKLQLK